MSDSESELAAANARIAELEKGDPCGTCCRARDAANARAEAAEQACMALSLAADGWRAKCDAAERSDKECERLLDIVMRQRDRAEAAALRAELSKSQAHAKFASDEHGKADAECESLRTRLAEARALLEDVVAVHGDDINVRGISAWLDANPESPRAMTAVERGKVMERLFDEEEPPRSATERAVACPWCNRAYCARDACKAELARREADK